MTDISGNNPLERLLVDQSSGNMGSTTTTKEKESRRQLPEGQVKNDESVDEAEPVELTPHEETEILSQRLTDVEKRTNEDGTVQGKIKAIHNTKDAGSSVAVEVDVPGQEENYIQRFKEPRIWVREYDLVRFAENYGYGASNLAGMIEDEVRVDVAVKDNDYELIIPRKRRSVAADKTIGNLKRAGHRVRTTEKKEVAALSTISLITYGGVVSFLAMMFSDGGAILPVVAESLIAGVLASVWIFLFFLGGAILSHAVWGVPEE